MTSLKERRLELNLKRTEVAATLNIPYKTLEKWESGERTPPTYTAAMLEGYYDEYEKTENFLKSNPELRSDL